MKHLRNSTSAFPADVVVPSSKCKGAGGHGDDEVTTIVTKNPVALTKTRLLRI